MASALSSTSPSIEFTGHATGVRPAAGGRAWRLHAVLAAGLAAYAIAFFAWTAARPFGRESLAFLAVSDVAGALPALAGAAIAVLAARRAEGRPRRGWFLLASGWLAWGLGETVWGIYEVILRVETPFPSLVDVGYLASIPLMLAGIVMLMPRESEARHWADVVSAGATALVGAALIWHFVVSDIFAQSDVGLLQQVLSAAYPVGDLLLLAVLALALRKVWRGIAGIILAVLFIGLMAFLAADLVFAYLEVQNRYLSGNLATDPAWVGGFLLMAYAAGLQALFGAEYRVVLSARRRARWLGAVPAVVLVIVGALFAGDALGADGRFHLDRMLAFVGAVGGAAILAHVLLVLTDNVEVVLDTRQELRNAAELQATLMPVPNHRGDHYELAARYLPARNLGGDFYDWWEQPSGTLHIAFGDVMGKGLGAALLMASMRTALRACARGSGVSETIVRAADLMANDFTNTSAFSTLFYARFETRTNTLTYVDCGHGLSFVLTPEGDVHRLPATSLPLGTLDTPYDVRSTEVRLGPGYCLFVCSDGLLDLLPDLMAPRTLASVLRGARFDAPHAVERALLTALDAGTPEDDVTLLLLRLPEASPRGELVPTTARAAS
ncbi:MAG: PP2C family protein-serine/threonine phosphatase [Dehalococcoidia bacterium]